jgi:hypothetical protein
MPLHTASISAFPSLANTRDNKMNSLYIVLYFWQHKWVAQLFIKYYTMKNFMTFLLLTAILGSVFAQKDMKGRLYEKTYYKESTIEMGDVTVYLTDIVATDAYMKFKMKVKNNATNFILFDPNRMTLTCDGKDYKPSERKLFISPNDMESRVIDIKGPAFRSSAYTLHIDGLSKVPSSGKFTEAPNFKLPVAVNEISLSNFKVVYKFSDCKTDKTSVKFEITYTGNNIGLFDPRKVVLKMSKGMQYANMNPSRKLRVLMPNEPEVISVIWVNVGVANGDMQFDNMEVLWKDAFMEAKQTILPSKIVTIEYDPGLTVGKN